MRLGARITTSSILDLGVYLTILVGAWIYFATTWLDMMPYAWNRGDIQQVLGFLAADRMPGKFEGDLVLDDPANYRNYWSLHNPVIRLLTEIVGDPGTAVVILLPLQIAVYGCGWYLFGRTVFRSTFWGLVLLVANLATIKIVGLGTYWGIVWGPLPRQTFQAFLPLLLLAAWHYRLIPKAKPWLMVAAGLLLYTHAVSGATMGFAIFLGFLWFWPPEWTLTKRLWWMLFSGFVFLLTIAPFAIHYLSTYQHGTSDLDVQAVLRVMEFVYGSEFLTPWTAVINFSRIWISTGILPVACIAAAWLWRKEAERETLVLFLSWLGGVLLVSIFVPLIDHGLASARGAIPAELDVIRTIRYAIPFSFLIILLALYVASRDAPNQLTRVCIGLVAVVATIVQMKANPTTRLLQSLHYVTGSYPTQEFRKYNRDWVNLLETVRTKTPPGSRIAASGAGRKNPWYIAIRYLANRSLVYTFKDASILGYTNHGRLLQWFDRSKGFERVQKIQNPAERLAALVSLVQGWGATYLILDEADRLTPQNVPARARLVYENGSFQLLELNPPPPLSSRSE